MIQSLWKDGKYQAWLETLSTKTTVGVHRAWVRWPDGTTRDSHLKIVFSTGERPDRHLVHEALAWLIANALDLPVPELAGFLILNSQQISRAHPDRPEVDRTLAWVTSTIDQGPLAIMPGMEQDAHLTRELKEWQHLRGCCGFDEWLGNTDRYPRNLLRRGPSDFVLIDHDNITGSAHWLADALLNSHRDQFKNVLRERCSPKPGGNPCPERAFSNAMLEHATAYPATISKLAEDILLWLHRLVDDDTDAWAMCAFITQRANLIQGLIRGRYGLLM
ncbi:hypothetical protein JN531_003855 [Flagellatimonas centrodinii]|uniref:hypothetical protein n=1 Tax=Flagellatimonas centrodinii TaxID=2806210 RepID=UPI001FEE7844|nr:hypothetical protein [Flagellatimonas centrodinii]ULQ47422.1 hypothetical protein JN531_003855 [Flagellatimonas centrodinii]